MRQPVIGISTYGVAHSDGFNIPAVYVMAVVRAGGWPVLLPPVSVDAVDAWIDRIQGLVLTGGGDVDPARYGASPHASVHNVDAARDDCEIALAVKAIRRRLPMLAICRGIQVLNVALGGTLHQHLPEVYGDVVPHRVPPRIRTRHPVQVAPTALLSTAMGGRHADVVSWHHQAVDRLGPGLRPVAWSSDGLIEAVELDGNPYLLAVQWHPELSATEDPSQQALFDRHVAMAAGVADPTPPNPGLSVKQR